MYVEYNSPLDNSTPLQILAFLERIIDANIIQKESEKQLFTAWVLDCPKMDTRKKVDFISRIKVAGSHEGQFQNPDCPVCKKIVQLFHK
jgi:hypothetical protein